MVKQNATVSIIHQPPLQGSAVNPLRGPRLVPRPRSSGGRGLSGYRVPGTGTRHRFSAGKNQGKTLFCLAAI